MTPNKIIILGKGNGREYAPYKVGEGEELWAVNNSVFDRKADRLFYLHYPEDTAEWDEMRIKALEDDTLIVNQNGGVEGTEKYPLKEIIEKYGVFYFANSIGFMIAYAMYIGIKEIDIYGIPLNTDTEYIYEKANVEFWLGYALGQGVKIRIYDLGDGTLMKTKDGRVYGWDLQKKEIVPDWKSITVNRGIFELAKPVYERQPD